MLFRSESSKSDHRWRNNRGLKFGQIWYFPKRNRDYIFNFLDVGANIIYDKMELHDITEDSSKFYLNPTPKFGKALYQAEDSNEKNSFRGQETLESLKLMLKIHICQDEDHPKISSPLDEKSCEMLLDRSQVR